MTGRALKAAGGTKRRLVLLSVLPALMAVFFIIILVVMVTGIAAARLAECVGPDQNTTLIDANAGIYWTEEARKEIPANYLALYEQASRTVDIDARFLAGIGQEESGHGKNPAAFRVNSMGCLGPMQIGIGVGKCGDFAGEFGLDGNGDGEVNVAEPADAIYTAANGLRKGKQAPAIGGSRDQYAKSASNYNGGSMSYADKVMASADRYGFGTAQAPAAAGVPAAGSGPAGPVDMAGTGAELVSGNGGDPVTPGGEGGNWGGAMPRCLQWASMVPVRLGSQKRPREKTSAKLISDHYVGAPSSYAVDLQTRVPDGDPYARTLGAAIGIPNFQGGEWMKRTIDGYRYQIGWRVAEHYDHIHIGCRRVGASNGSTLQVSMPTNPAASLTGVNPGAAGGVDAGTLDAWLSTKFPGNPLIGKGAAFVESGSRHRIDPRLLVAIAYNESALGTAGSGKNINNAFGLGPAIKFPTWEAGIEMAAKTLANYERDGLRSIVQIQGRWAPVGASNDPTNLNSNWVRGVSTTYRELGGNPDADVSPWNGSGAPATNQAACATTMLAAGTSNQSAVMRAEILSILKQELDLGLRETREDCGPPLDRYWPTKADCKKRRPWSTAFASWVLIKAGASNAHFTVANDFKPWASESSVWRPPDATPEPGDVIIRRDQGKLRADIVEQVFGDTIIIVGGNINDTVARGRVTVKDAAIVGYAAPTTPDVAGTGYMANALYGRVLPTVVSGGGFGYSDPEGQGGRHMAIDWFAPGGTPCASPATGVVARVKEDPTPGQVASGQVFGGVISIRDTQGQLWVLRHVTPMLPVGTRVQAGQQICTVKAWSGSSHVHLEVYRPGSSDYEYSAAMALNPYEILHAQGLV